MQALLDWWAHPVTQAAFAVVGAVGVIGGIDRSLRLAAGAHERIDALEGAA